MPRSVTHWGFSEMQAKDPTAVGGAPTSCWKPQLDAFERQVISATLRKTGGRVGLAAEALGIQRKTLYLRMRKFGLDRKDFADDTFET